MNSQLPASEHVTLPATMKAVVRHAYGEADLLAVETIPVPSPGESDVLVRVSAAAVDRGLWHLMAGLPYPVRLAGFGVRAPKNPGIGSDVAGTVVAVGRSVTDFAVGDRVFGVSKASCAEYATAPAAKLALMPDSLSFASAAAIPFAGLTALQAVRDHGRVESGQSVLVIGASGGVGSFAVQIAKAFGAAVTGVCSTSKVGFVESLGADQVIDYQTTSLSPGGSGYDVILDIGGNRSLSALRKLLAPRGTLVIVGGENAGKVLGGIDRQLRGVALSPFIKQKITMFVASENSADLVVLREMVEKDQITVPVDRTFPLEDAAQAVQYVVDGKVRGKAVVVVD